MSELDDAREKREKFAKALDAVGLTSADLDEQPDDRLEEQIDEYERYVELLTARGYSAAAPLVAAQLMHATRLDDIEMAIAGFRDDLMLQIETGGLPMKIPSTEELFKRYNPEVLELIKHGDAEMEIYDDRVVLRRKLAE